MFSTMKIKGYYVRTLTAMEDSVGDRENVASPFPFTLCEFQTDAI